MVTATPNEVLLRRFTTAAYQAGCPQGQTENLLRAGIVLQPRQLEASAAARECDTYAGPNQVGFGGARGGGKSHWLIAQIGADDCQRHPGLKALILRKVGRAVRESFEDLRLRVFSGLKHTYRRQDGVLEFPNGSRIVLGHFKDEKDIDAYLGLEYDVIGIEEATTLSSTKYKAIRTCCRTSKQDWRPRTYSTTNPGGVGHAWYKAEFIAPYRKRQEQGTRFVPATVSDNSFVDREYRSRLAELTGWQREAWLEGNWDIASGAFFTTFKRSVHVLPSTPLPAHWRKWCALDYGFTHYTVVYLVAEDGDGNLYVVDEHAERGWLPQRHVPAIEALLGRHDLTLAHLWKFVAGADVFMRRPTDEGTAQSIADTYKGLGVRLEAANDDRVNGAGEILSRLGDPEAGVPPRLFIFDRCARLAESLPEMLHDPNRPEDVLKVHCDEDGLGGDDFYDAARYGVMAAKQQKLESRPDLYQQVWDERDAAAEAFWSR
jgi:hypothetical protein